MPSRWPWASAAAKVLAHTTRTFVGSTFARPDAVFVSVQDGEVGVGGGVVAGDDDGLVEEARAHTMRPPARQPPCPISRSVAPRWPRVSEGVTVASPPMAVGVVLSTRSLPYLQSRTGAEGGIDEPAPCG